MVTKQNIEQKLKTVLDPELGISIVDLGLIYKIKITGADVEVLMTLTTIGCPLFGTIEEDIRHAVKKVKGVGKIFVNLTFEPAWNPDRMSKEAKLRLGLE